MPNAYVMPLITTGETMVLGMHVCRKCWMNLQSCWPMDQYLGILLNTMLPIMEDLFGDQMCISQHDNNPTLCANATKMFTIKVFMLNVSSVT